MVLMAGFAAEPPTNFDDDDDGDYSYGNNGRVHPDLSGVPYQAGNGQTSSNYFRHFILPIDSRINSSALFEPVRFGDDMFNDNDNQTFGLHSDDGGNDVFNHSHHVPEHCVMFQMIMNTVVIGFMCLFGVTGNVLSISILHRDRHNRVAVFLLQSLAVADSSVLIIAFVVLSLFFGLFPYLAHGQSSFDTSRAWPYLIKYINPVGYAVQSCAIWITVLLALNRFIAVCLPFKAERWLSLRTAIIQINSAKKGELSSLLTECLGAGALHRKPLVTFLASIRLVVVIVVTSVALNIPRVFQWDIDSEVVAAMNTTSAPLDYVYRWNGTSAPSEYHAAVKSASARGRVHYSSLGRRTDFEVGYLVIFYTIVVLVGPLLLLVALNASIIVSLQRSRRRMKRNSIGHRYSGQEKSITVVMVAVIMELIVCHLPDRIVTIIDYVAYPDGNSSPVCPDPLYYGINLGNLLVVISSSTNFLIYFALRRRFRDTVRHRLRRLCSRIRGQPYDITNGQFAATSNGNGHAHRYLHNNCSTDRGHKRSYDLDSSRHSSSATWSGVGWGGSARERSSASVIQQNNESLQRIAKWTKQWDSAHRGSSTSSARPSLVRPSSCFSCVSSDDDEVDIQNAGRTVDTSATLCLHQQPTESSKRSDSADVVANVDDSCIMLPVSIVKDDNDDVLALEPLTSSSESTLRRDFWTAIQVETVDDCV